MRNLLIGLCIAAVFMEVSGLIWASKSDQPNEAFVRLSEAPSRSIENPLENGYFLLLGFLAAPTSDPIHKGYEMWLEAEPHPNLRTFNYDKPGRADLLISLDPGQAMPAWDSPQPLAELKKQDNLFRTSMDRYAWLLKRYQQWLTMRFEDWGGAHRASPRFNEIAIAHRLYVAEGFARNTKAGLERLGKDLIAWRNVLRDAKTIPMKVAALVMIDDDVMFLSKLLARLTVDHVILETGHRLAQPLTPAEYSLRWPIHTQFELGLKQDVEALDIDGLLGADQSDSNREWLALMAHLHADVFHKVEHPISTATFGIPLFAQRTWDAYAAFYDATIKASESIHSPLPKLQDIARSSRHTLLEAVMHSLEFEPNWEPFSQRLMETDAHLRLAGMQVMLRLPSTTSVVPARLAEGGPRYFDPFTGLPMLWSETQGKVYSVGKDGLDDGGDNSFDITIPAIVSHPVSAANPAGPPTVKTTSSHKRKTTASKRS
ncbi:MAG: hypothetical protein ACT4OO_13630 [Nitrospiraceae bacterium]